MSDIAIDVAREVVDNDLDMGEKKEDAGSVYFCFVVWGLIISIALRIAIDYWHATRQS